MLATGGFYFIKPSVDFRCFQVFVFCHRPYSKTRKRRKVLVCYFSMGRTFFMLLTKLCKSFCVIRREVSKYCSKLSMQTESWILKQFCSFVMPNRIDVTSWSLLSIFLVTRSFSNRYFPIRKNFYWFPPFLGFRFLPYTLIFYKQYFFFQLSLSVPKLFLWNFLWNVGWVLLNTYKFHHTDGLFIFSICEPMSRRKSIYAVSVWPVFFLTFIIIDPIISLKHTH